MLRLGSDSLIAGACDETATSELSAWVLDTDGAVAACSLAMALASVPGFLASVPGFLASVPGFLADGPVVCIASLAPEAMVWAVCIMAVEGGVDLLLVRCLVMIGKSLRRRSTSREVPSILITAMSNCCNCENVS